MPAIMRQMAQAYLTYVCGLPRLGVVAELVRISSGDESDKRLSLDPEYMS